MRSKKITEAKLEAYRQYLLERERRSATVEKYIRDVRKFKSFVGDMPITKELVIAYKESLKDRYALASINSMLVAVNRFFEFRGWSEYKVELIKRQRRLFVPANKELTKQEYYRLIHAAERNGKERLALILQTIGATGIRISELAFITLEAVHAGQAEVDLKGKIRTIFIPKDLKKKLVAYAESRDIARGSIFVTKSGKALNRSNVWKEMKALCEEAKVNPEKVYPHNLRHLFAREFYAVEKDIAKLADVLGHSSIETTRIYIISTGREHEQQMERLRLIV